MSRILVIEDDERTARTVAEVLSALNHVVDTAATGPDGLEHLLTQHYELAIVDWGLPGMEGFTVCQKYREKGGKSPILFLTAEEALQKKVRALDCGADDYVCKPFSLSELVARVNALLRRPREEPPQILQFGSLSMDLASCEVTIAGERVPLTGGEFKLLQMFMQRPNQVFSITQILDHLCADEPDPTESGIRQKIMVIRKKLSRDNYDASIVTIKGVGYKFEPKSAE